MKNKMMYVVLVLAIMFVILSCDKDSTGPSDDETTFEWCDVPAGDYTWGENDEIQNIDYDYQIMKYKVTNAEFKQFLNEAFSLDSVWLEGDCVEGYYPGDTNTSAGNQNFYSLGLPSSNNFARISFYNGNFIINEPIGYANGDFDNHPVIQVTWFGAWAFAQHYGLRLPTEQEWEKAARGLTGYEYPFGNTLSGDRANYKDSGDPWDNGTTPVGYYNGQHGTSDSSSPSRVYDMCGNVYDWTDSWYNSSSRVLRGGGWYSDSIYNGLRSWSRYGNGPTCGGIIGFRCAKTL